jgi:hypothetical protein
VWGDYSGRVHERHCAGEVQQKYLSAIGLNLVAGKTTGSESQKQTA